MPGRRVTSRIRYYGYCAVGGELSRLNVGAADGSEGYPLTVGLMIRRKGAHTYPAG
jgi:hypothetical protein